MVDWNKVVTNMGRGMDPMSAYNRAEREEREEHRKRMERLRGAKPERRGRALSRKPEAGNAPGFSFWDA